ncbi:hypothetical protein OOZ63_23725 [Paucibacter sp. PLA-PC-4]|uniref:hypothetical protein n=1 Tax=Paucibacter sp. PLA-PC-4 TaxID=2993655 RepID=UPI00224B801C|nr:hypothetical protein [Paucibacter sp. PLA-PC-4]MCX2864846.1 hypothetical protein [Paucibacter sp. PLA-PC-4]
MLRVLVLALLLLNLLFFGWSQGWLDTALGLRAGGEGEPERLQLAQHADRVTVMSPQAISAMQTRSCLELAPLPGDDALKAAQAALERFGLGSSDWRVQSSDVPGRWVVATYKFESGEQQARKEEVFKRLRLAYEQLPAPQGEQPSLVLSQHASAEAAEAALASYEKRALRGLRVLQLQAPGQLHSLQLPSADGSVQTRLLNAKDPALAPGFKTCPPVPAVSAASAA